jgi:hypothetical protein
MLALSERREQADVQAALAKLTKEVPYETACELLADLTGITVRVHAAHEVTNAICGGTGCGGESHARARAGESGPGGGGAKTATDSGAGDGRGRRGDAPAECAWNSSGAQAKYAPNVRAGEAGGTKSILFLASLRERKGLFLLLAALPHVLRSHPTLRVTIAGTWQERGRAPT